jgi:hypothetical protein
MTYILNVLRVRHAAKVFAMLSACWRGQCLGSMRTSKRS